MTLIKSIKITKKVQDPNDWNYDLHITNEGLSPQVTLTKSPQRTLGVLDFYYSLPAGQNPKSKFAWETPHTIDFSSYNLNDVTKIILVTDPPNFKKAHIAIKDTEFPPPDDKYRQIGITTSAVTDLWDIFSLTRLEVIRNSSNDKTDVTIQIDLSSLNNTTYNTTTQFRFQQVTLNSGKVIDAILLYPKVIAAGAKDISFNLNSLDLSAATSKEGIAILVVDGDPTTHAQLPVTGIMKKGMFWIE